MPSIRNSGLAVLAACTLACDEGGDASRAPSAVQLGDAIVLIGGNDSIAGHDLFRITGAARTPDGHIFVANLASAEVRVFSPEGVLVRAFSQQGEGPGEHQALSGLWMFNDTVATFDVSAQKIVYWSTTGEMIDERRFAGSQLDVRGRLQNGTFLSASSRQSGGMPAGTMRVDSAIVSIVDAGTSEIREIARVPAFTTYAATLPTGRVMYTGLQFEPQMSIATGSEEFYIGYGSDTVVVRYDSEGNRAGTIALPLRHSPFTQEERDAWRETMLARVADGERPAMARYLDSLPYPANLPLFDRLCVDDEDRVWVRHFPRPGNDSVTWSVIDANGVSVFTVTAPARMEIVHIAHGFITASYPTDDGVERIGVWRVTSPR